MVVIRRTKVFVSYSHKDVQSLEPLHAHLGPLKRSGRVDFFDDQTIELGEDWKEKIDFALDRARIAILLVSAYFLDSDFILKHELPPLLEAAEGDDPVRIIPVFLSKAQVPERLSKWHGPTSPEKPLLEMGRGEQQAAWDKVRKTINRHLGSLPIATFYDRADRTAVEPVLRELEVAGMEFESLEWNAEMSVGELATIRAGTSDSAVRGEDEALMTLARENWPTLVFFGARGLGPWANERLAATLRDKNDLGLPLMAGLLPGLSSEVELPSALPPTQRVKLVDSRELEAYSRKIDRLKSGLTGEPGAPPKKNSGLEEKAGGEAGSEIDKRVEREEQAPLKSLVEDIAGLLSTRPLTVILGPGATPNIEEIDSEISEELLSALVEAPGGGAALPLPVTGEYYAIGKTETNLEVRFFQLLRERTQTDPPRTHELVADLMSELTRPGNSANLIVTATLDLFMERALLRRRVPFTRVVYSRRGKPGFEVNEFAKISEADGSLVVETRDRLDPDRVETSRAKPESLDELDGLIRDHGRHRFPPPSKDGARTPELHELPVQRYASPILYKPLGSVDIDDSSVIAAGQYLRLMSAVGEDRLVPREIKGCLSTGQILLVGFRLPDDPCFWLKFHSVLKDAPEIPRYMFQQPRGQLRQHIWDKLVQWAPKSLGIEIHDIDQDALLESLVAVARAQN